MAVALTFGRLNETSPYHAFRAEEGFLQGVALCGLTRTEWVSFVGKGDSSQCRSCARARKSRWQREQSEQALRNRQPVRSISDAQAIQRVREQCKNGKARRIRERARLSRGEAARAIGVQGSTIFRWEQGERLPRAGTALAYAQLLTSLSGKVNA